MPTEKALKDFDDHLEKWRSYDLMLATRSELGTEALVGLAEIINGLTSKLEDTDSVKLEMPSDVLHNIGHYAMRILELCNFLAIARPEDFIQSKQEFFKEIQSKYELIQAIWLNSVLPAKLAVTGVHESSEKVTIRLREIQARVEEQTKRAQNLLDDLNVKAETFSKSSQALKDATVIKEEDIFTKAAKHSMLRATVWGILVFVVSVVFLCILHSLLKDFCFEVACFDDLAAKNYDAVCENCGESVLYLEIAKAVAYRLLVISFLLFLVGICVKNYYAAMHNYIISTHKANSLAAARSMLSLNLSPKANDDLMTLAASAIFSHQSTGYNSKEPQNPSAYTLLSKLGITKDGD